MRRVDIKRAMSWAGVLGAICVLCLSAWMLGGLRVSVTTEMVRYPEWLMLMYRGASDASIKRAIQSTNSHPDQLAEGDGTALYYAVSFERKEVVSWLLNQGASPDGAGLPRVPLVCAVENEDIECTRILLKHGADPDINGVEGVTARDLAEASGNRELRGLLREDGR